MANAYRLGSVKEFAENTFGGRARHGFDVFDKPLVHFAFEPTDEAEKARTQMVDIVASALLTAVRALTVKQPDLLTMPEKAPERRMLPAGG